MVRTQQQIVDTESEIKFVKKVHQSPNANHPNFHVAVSMGLGTLAEGEGKKVYWDWDLIRQLWAVDTDYNTIKKFCQAYGIAYVSAKQKLRLADKQIADRRRTAIGKMLLDEISLPDQSLLKTAAELIETCLGGAIDNLNAINKYVSAHLIDVTEDGQRVVNIKLDKHTVKDLSLIQKRSTDQISRLFESHKDLSNAVDIPPETQIEPVAIPVPDQRDVIAKITKGGVAQIKPVEGGLNE